jgi:hypothetical protein
VCQSQLLLKPSRDDDGDAFLDARLGQLGRFLQERMGYGLSTPEETAQPELERR